MLSLQQFSGKAELWNAFTLELFMSSAFTKRRKKCVAGCKTRQTILIICSDIVNTTSQSFTRAAAVVPNNSLLDSGLGFSASSWSKYCMYWSVYLSFLIIFASDQLTPKIAAFHLSFVVFRLLLPGSLGAVICSLTGLLVSNSISRHG